MANRKLIIAIDGPSGAGKSTVARRIASKLGYRYIDTGAMYRAVALRSLRLGLSLSDESGCEKLSREARIEFVPGASGQRVLLDGEDVSAEIRTPEVTQLSSPISAIPGVRRVLVALQQEMGRGGGIVMEGRDIGTVVFPKADVKVYLTASEEERGRRRLRDLEAAGKSLNLDEVIAMQRERDERDSSRSDSPLAAAPDAVTLDSDPMNADEVVQTILEMCRERMAARQSA